MSDPNWFVGERSDFKIPKGAVLGSCWDMTDLGQEGGAFWEGSARLRILEMDGRGYEANEIRQIYEGTLGEFIETICRRSQEENQSDLDQNVLPSSEKYRIKVIEAKIKGWLNQKPDEKAGMKREYQELSNLLNLIASKILRAPNPSAFAVYSGDSNETCTCD